MKFERFKKQFGVSALMFLAFFAFSALPALAANPLSSVGKAVAGTGLDKNTNIAGFVGGLVEAVLGFLGLLLVCLIVYAGFIWTMARGEAKEVEKAKNMIKQGVIGLAIVFAAYAIEFFIVSQLMAASSVR